MLCYSYRLARSTDQLRVRPHPSASSSATAFSAGQRPGCLFQVDHMAIRAAHFLPKDHRQSNSTLQVDGPKIDCLRPCIAFLGSQINEVRQTSPVSRDNVALGIPNCYKFDEGLSDGDQTVNPGCRSNRRLWQQNLIGANFGSPDEDQCPDLGHLSR